MPDYPPTLPEVIHVVANRYEDLEAVVSGDTRLSFRDLERHSAKLARGFLAAGVGKGTRVGTLIPNTPDWVLSFMGAARIGAFVVPMSTMYQARELKFIIPNADIDTLLVVDRYLNHDYLSRLEQAFPSLAGQKADSLYLPEAPYLRRIIVWGKCDRPWAFQGPDYLHDLAQETPEIDDDYVRATEESVTPADLLLMIYTSGSTADPKGVAHTHGTVIRHTHVLNKNIQMETGDKLATLMPFFWIGGLNVTLFPALYRGVTLFLPESTETGDLLDLILRERITSITAWVTQVAAIKTHPKYNDEDFSFMTGRMAAPVDADGKPIPRERISGGLGMTESFGPHSQGKVGELLPLGKESAFGQKMAGIDRQIRDSETGAVLPSGQPGELWIRGYSLMSGLYKKEREETFDAGGFYNTGDNCTIDEDGYLFFHGRLGEMVKTMGANVAPREVEVVLESLPDIQEAAVMGVEDPAMGERLIAVVVPAAGANPDEEDLKIRLKDEVSTYKVPRNILIRKYADLPRTDASKPHKRKLKDKLLAEGWLD